MNDFVIIRADFKSFFDSVLSRFVYEKLHFLPCYSRCTRRTERCRKIHPGMPLKNARRCITGRMTGRELLKKRRKSLQNAVLLAVVHRFADLPGVMRGQFPEKSIGADKFPRQLPVQCCTPAS